MSEIRKEKYVMQALGDPSVGTTRRIVIDRKIVQTQTFRTLGPAASTPPSEPAE